MDNIIDLIATDASPSDVSNEIKSAIFAKAADKIDQIRPYVANSLFGIEDYEETEDVEDVEEVEQ